MNWFWHALLLCAIIVPLTILWLAILIELFQRRDMHRWVKLAWILAILVLPLVGSLAYVLVTWLKADAVTDLGAAPTGASAPVHPSTVSDLTQLDQLRRSGAVSEAEFEAGKRQILEGETAGRHAETRRQVGS